jgi:hypothetical protein
VMAREGAHREEGCRPDAPRRGAPPRRAPLPVHRLREDPRCDRAPCVRRSGRGARVRRCRHERVALPGPRADAR